MVSPENVLRNYKVMKNELTKFYCVNNSKPNPFLALHTSSQSE